MRSAPATQPLAVLIHAGDESPVDSEPPERSTMGLDTVSPPRVSTVPSSVLVGPHATFTALHDAGHWLAERPVGRAPR